MESVFLLSFSRPLKGALHGAIETLSMYGTIHFQGPTLTDAAPQSSISFTRSLDSNNGIQSLSTTGVTAGSDIGGLLYVPQLANSDPCTNLSSQYIARNVTRKASLPSGDVSLVAIAPWISATCTKSYLESASVDGVNGFLVYIARDINLVNYTAAIPPPSSDVAWTLDGDPLQSQQYPVFAINADDGNLIMDELSD